MTNRMWALLGMGLMYVLGLFLGACLGPQYRLEVAGWVQVTVGLLLGFVSGLFIAKATPRF